MSDDGFEALVVADGLVGTHLVEPFALGVPASLAELKERGGMTGWRVGMVFERVRIEMDVDQGK